MIAPSLSVVLWLLLASISPESGSYRGGCPNPQPLSADPYMASTCSSSDGVGPSAAGMDQWVLAAELSEGKA